MKIVSWNCNGKFREKYKVIQELNADIYIIQECENPNTITDDDFNSFAINYIWNGENKNKGLGIFAKKEIILNDNKWDTNSLRNFISVNVNNKFDLIGVWACNPYIQEYYNYQNINFNKYNSNTIIMGDFNSNKIWDKKNSPKNHSNVVRKLASKELISAYHSTYNEEQGEECQNTFYHYRNLEKGYHIDHCFINKKRIKKYEVLSAEKWLQFSDHIPILLETYDL